MGIVNFYTIKRKILLTIGKTRVKIQKKGGECMVNIRDSITLKACRVIADVKAEDIAEAVGVTVDTIYKWEKSKSYPTAPQLVKIIKFFETKGYLIELDDIKFF